MLRTRQLVSLVAIVVLSVASQSPALERREWTVDGVAREAMLHLPAVRKSPAPLVFVFHGHGGNSNQAARSFRIHELWPEAIVVYPQGLKTPGKLTDPDGKRPGWQRTRDDQAGRDLAFFDVMLKSLRADHAVDDTRVYCTGHSNGGAFTYLLWSARGDTFAAVAPSGALDREAIKDLKPKPVLHIAGRQDQLVKFEWQQRMIDAVLAINGCERTGAATGQFHTTYESKLNAPVETYIHEKGHGFPADASTAIVEFFKKHPAKAKP